MVCWVKDETLKTLFVKQEVLKAKMACTSSYLVSNMFSYLVFFTYDLSVKTFSSLHICEPWCFEFWPFVITCFGIIVLNLLWLVTTNHD